MTAAFGDGATGVPGAGAGATGVPGAGDVLDLIRATVARVLEVEPGSVTAATRLVEDLHADSLALVEVVELVEEALAERHPGVHVEDEVLDGLRTVGDAVGAVLAALAAPAGTVSP